MQRSSQIRVARPPSMKAARLTFGPQFAIIRKTRCSCLLWLLIWLRHRRQTRDKPDHAQHQIINASERESVIFTCELHGGWQSNCLSPCATSSIKTPSAFLAIFYSGMSMVHARSIPFTFVLLESAHSSTEKTETITTC